jgi:hypothetical protein
MLVSNTPFVSFDKAIGLGYFPLNEKTGIGSSKCVSNLKGALIYLLSFDLETW